MLTHRFSQCSVFAQLAVTFEQTGSSYWWASSSVIFIDDVFHHDGLRTITAEKARTAQKSRAPLLIINILFRIQRPFADILLLDFLKHLHHMPHS